MILVLGLYVVTSLVGIYSFGGNLQQNILQDLGVVYNGKGVYPESYVMQGLFLIILTCHIPYCFFAGKESLLIIIDELMRNSLSYALSKKLLSK